VALVQTVSKTVIAVVVAGAPPVVAKAEDHPSQSELRQYENDPVTIRVRMNCSS